MIEFAMQLVRPDIKDIETFAPSSTIPERRHIESADRIAAALTNLGLYDKTEELRTLIAQEVTYLNNRVEEESPDFAGKIVPYFAPRITNHFPFTWLAARFDGYSGATRRNDGWLDDNTFDEHGMNMRVVGSAATAGGPFSGQIMGLVRFDEVGGDVTLTGVNKGINQQKDLITERTTTYGSEAKDTELIVATPADMLICAAMDFELGPLKRFNFNPNYTTRFPQIVQNGRYSSPRYPGFGTTLLDEAEFPYASRAASGNQGFRMAIAAIR